MHAEMGPEHHQCDNDDCERIHDFCPRCGEKTSEYERFEGQDASDVTVPRADTLCLEWDGDTLWLYWHEDR